MVSRVKTVNGYQKIIAVDADNCEFKPVNFSKQKRGKTYYLWSNDFAVFDSETSHDNLDRGWIYQWSFKFQGQYIYGRRPSEFIKLLEKLSDYYKLTANKKIIIYIHNASYDIQYLKRYLYEYDNSMKFVATDVHTILIADIKGFRILCSYKLSNLSLDLFSKNYAIKYRKAVGDIDYTKVRYQDDKLTDIDWEYMFSDVASQYDAIQQYLKINGYDYAWQAPFTSTGFVRVNCRHASEEDRTWRKEFKESALSLDQYKLCRQAFIGGLCIASYRFVGQTVRGNIKHKDFVSSYPARQMMDYFPVGKSSWYGDIDNDAELNELINKYCCIFVFHAKNIQIKSGITAPYIPSSKCFFMKNELKLNGKLIYADEIAIAITEIDYKWIVKQYDFADYRIDNMLIFKRGVVPQWLKTEIMKYFINKCTLKNSNPKLYLASKGLLNAIYGMSATAIIRNEYELDSNIILEKKSDIDEEKVLNDFYKSRNSFMPYQFGVYTTAHARNALMEMIEAVGYDKFLYCDTDSVFYIENEESERRLKIYNEQTKSRAIKEGAYYGDKILGVAEDEPDIRAFRALHAKCYAMEEKQKDSKYKLTVTIAGIPKASIKWDNGTPKLLSNAEELGNIDNLSDGFIFKHNGGTRIIYNETEKMITENINGHITEYASSAIIENIEKEISENMFSVGKNYELLKFKQEIII